MCPARADALELGEVARRHPADECDELAQPASVRTRRTRRPAPEGAAPVSRASGRVVFDVPTASSASPTRRSCRATGASSASSRSLSAAISWRDGGSLVNHVRVTSLLPAARTWLHRDLRRARCRARESRPRCRVPAAASRTSRTSGVLRGTCSALRPRRPASAVRRLSRLAPWRPPLLSRGVPQGRHGECEHVSTACSDRRRGRSLDRLDQCLRTGIRQPAGRVQVLGKPEHDLLGRGRVGWAPQMGVHHEKMDGVRTHVEHTQAHVGTLCASGRDATSPAVDD
jgi:hypothetical protein